MISLYIYFYLIIFISFNVYTLIIPIQLYYFDNISIKMLTIKIFLLWLIRVIHLFINLCFSTYIIFFITPKYDLIYIVLFILMMIHWNIFKGECILDYWEKKILDPTYMIGDNIYKHIYTEMIYSKFMQISVIFIMLTLIIIIYRSPYIHYEIIKFILSICIIFIVMYNEINMRPL